MKTHYLHEIYSRIHVIQYYLQQCASSEQTSRPNTALQLGALLLLEFGFFSGER